MIGTFLGSLVRGFKLFPVIVGAIIQIEQLQLKTAGWTWPESLTTLCTVVRIISIKFWVNSEQWTVNSSTVYSHWSQTPPCPHLVIRTFRMSHVILHGTRCYGASLTFFLLGNFTRPAFFSYFFHPMRILTHYYLPRYTEPKVWLKLTIFFWLQGMY